MTNRAPVLVSLEEYLTTDYSPDVDYLDGELEDRNVGENDHSYLQRQILVYLIAREKEWDIYAIQEQRVQISRTRYRIPDVCVMAGSRPSEPIFTQPPILCIEVLSPDDRSSRVQRKIDDYLGFGVRSVWVIDPVNRRAWVYTREGITEVKDGVLRAARPGGPEIVVPLHEIL